MVALEPDENNLTEDTKLAIANACLVNGRKDEAMQMLKSVVQNNPDSSKLQSQIAHIFKDHGGADVAKQLIDSSVKEVINLNNDAVQKAKSGAYAEASEMLTEAALRLPNNLQIVSNASLSILMDVFMNGYDSAKTQQAKQFQEAVTAQNSQYPKLAEIMAFQVKIQQKYKQEMAS
jgi:tetratricopeptide (TPR) repeat protein